MTDTVERSAARSSAPLAPPGPGVTTAEPGADAAALGLAAFGLTTFALSLINAGLFPEAVEYAVLPIAVFYGGVVQLIAGLWDLRKGNTFGATAFCSYGAFWLAFAAYAAVVEPALKAGGMPFAEVKTATALFVLGWVVFTAYVFVASLRTTAVVAGVYGLLFVTLLVFTLANFLLSAPLALLGGVLGLLTALLAWYAAAAALLNATYGRTVLPLGSRAAALPDPET